MSKISIVIPHYPVNLESEINLKNCIESMKGDHEVIIVVNEGIGFAKAVNQGLKCATGDWIFVVNNDLVLEEGDLNDLCGENIVTSPILNGEAEDFWGAFFCLPRKVYEQIGGLDERFKGGYYEDDDYIMRLKESGISMQSVPSVKVLHKGGRTMKYMDRKKLMSENKKRFDEKWNIKE